VSPAAGTLLTCSTTTFTATGGEVTWSATAGTIDGSGVYTAPGKVGPDATITATSKVNATQTASVTEKLVTAIPGAKQIVASKFTSYPSVFPHAVASRDDRVYATTVVSDGGWKLQVLRSDDGGGTWGAPVVANPIINDIEVSCPAIAVDAANPDTVYVVFNVDSHGGYAPAYVDKMIDDERALVLVVSTDGGKTFPLVRVLQSGNSDDPIPVAQGICPDVASLAADTVAVTTPGGSNVIPGDSQHSVGMYLWVDSHHGEGLTIKIQDGYNSMANGETGALIGVGAKADVGQNGGSNNATESPRLFSDGKGTLCVTYVAYTPAGSGSPSSTAWVQCSTDQGKTFSDPVAASPTYAYDGPHISHPTGTFGPKGEIAIGWHGYQSEPVGGVNVVGVAVSSDGGKTFTNVSAPMYQEPPAGFSADVADVRFDDAGVLWLAYTVYDGGLSNRIAVDKSCDLGKTWSGALTINEAPDGTVDHATLPSLVPTKGKIAVFAGANVGSAGSDTEMRRYPLTP
jgi:hypothetical protein